MILRLSWSGVTVLYEIAALLVVAASILNIAAVIIKRRQRNHPRCENCTFCSPIPDDACGHYNSSERHCLMGRGTDEFFDSCVSVVTVADFCSEYRPKPGKEKRHG